MVTEKLSASAVSVPTRLVVLVSSWLPCTTVNTVAAVTLPTSSTLKLWLLKRHDYGIGYLGWGLGLGKWEELKNEYLGTRIFPSSL